jgi:hypothetical protein
MEALIVAATITLLLYEGRRQSKRANKSDREVQLQAHPVLETRRSMKLRRTLSKQRPAKASRTSRRLKLHERIAANAAHHTTQGRNSHAFTK